MKHAQTTTSTTSTTSSATSNPGATPQSVVLMSRRRQYEKERDAAFASLDEAQIRALVTRWGLNIPAPVLRDKKAFWITVHKTRAALSSMTPQARAESRRFLEENGSEPMGVLIIKKGGRA